MVAVEHPDPLEEAKFNTESMGVPARARPNDAFVDQASARDKSYVGMVPGEQLRVDADELSSGNEAHANFFGVFQLGMIMPGSPEYKTLWAHTVVVQRLSNELSDIEELHLRVQQGCKLDAAQREMLGREDELFEALEAAVAAAEAAFAVPHTGPGSPQKSEVQSDLNNPRPLTRPSGPQEHKEQSTLVQRPQQSCATEAQIGPNNQHKEQSALVQRPQEPRVAETQIGPGSPREHEEQSALVQRPQKPRVAETQIGPGSPREHEEQSALVQRPQQPRVAETQIGPGSPREHEQQSALVQVRPQQPRATEAQFGPNSPHEEQSALVPRPQEPRVVETQIGPGSPREREEQQSALAQQQQQPHATEAQPEPRKPEHQSKPEPQKPEPQSVIEPQSRPEPGDPKPRAPQKPGKPKELRVETTDAEPDHWKPGGFEPRAFDPGGSTEKKVRKPAHNSCAPLRVRLRLRGDG